MKRLSVAVFVSFAVAVGCGDADPGGIGKAPGATSETTPTTQSGDGGATIDGSIAKTTPQSSSSDASAGIADAEPDTNPGYRDPHQSDAACSTPNKLCSNGDGGMVCIAIGIDVDNCGSCGTQCVGDSATCVGSRCACNNVGFDYCAGTGCMDVSGDINNCGACGNVCDPNNFNDCVAGSCVSD